MGHFQPCNETINGANRVQPERISHKTRTTVMIIGLTGDALLIERRHQQLQLMCRNPEALAYFTSLSSKIDPSDQVKIPPIAIGLISARTPMLTLPPSAPGGTATLVSTAAGSSTSAAEAELEVEPT